MKKTKPELSSQLAIDVDFDKMRFPLMGFRKVDGVRGNHFIGSFTGRSLKPFENLHTTAKFSHSVYAGMDGELTADGRLTGDDLCSLTGSYTRRVQGEPHVVLNVFDMLTPFTVTMKYIDRYNYLCSYVSQHNPDNVRVLPFVWIRNRDEAEAFYNESLDLGFEGAVFREPEAMHKSGRATAKLNDFWRMKPTSDKDAQVIGIEEAMTNNNEAKVNELGQTDRSTHKENLTPKGMVGVLICLDLESGQTIRVSPGKMSHKERVDIMENPSLILEDFIKYRSLDTGVKEAPRQARYICRRVAADIS